MSFYDEKDPFGIGPLKLSGNSTPESSSSSSSGKGSGGGLGGLLGGGGGAGGAISSIADTAMKIYLAKEEKKRKERAYRDALMEKGRQGAESAMQQDAGSTLQNTGLLGQYFLKDLLGG